MSLRRFHGKYMKTTTNKIGSISLTALVRWAKIIKFFSLNSLSDIKIHNLILKVSFPALTRCDAASH